MLGLSIIVVGLFLLIAITPPENENKHIDNSKVESTQSYIDNLYCALNREHNTCFCILYDANTIAGITTAPEEMCK